MIKIMRNAEGEPEVKVDGGPTIWEALIFGVIGYIAFKFVNKEFPITKGK